MSKKREKNKSRLVILLFVIIAVIVGIAIFLLNQKKDEGLFGDNVYAINNRDFYLYSENIYEKDEEYRGIKLLEYDNSNSEYAELYYILYDYSTEEGYRYILNVTDNSGNSILFNQGEEVKVIGGVISKIQIKKVDLNKTITFGITELYYDEELNSAKKEINLGTDLANKTAIDQSDKTIQSFLVDIVFKYVDHEYTYYGTTKHAYSENFEGENYSIPLRAQYGNRLVDEEYIDFVAEKNVNNLSLEDAFKSLSLITKTFGQYGLSDVYGMDIDKTEAIETFLVTYNELMDICNGKTITKDGKTLTRDSFDKSEGAEYTKVGNVTIGNNFSAIKYTDSTDTNHEKYMFVCKDHIYYVSVPTEKRVSNQVKDFLTSLTEMAEE